MQPSNTNTDAPAVDKLVKAGRAGWANDPSGTGSVLVERATGCVIQSSNGTPITRPQRDPYPSVRLNKGKFRAHVGFFEGVVQYMYLDVEGNVTVGIGHLLKDVAAAEALPFYRRHSQQNPHPVHVANAFNKVRSNLGLAKNGHTAFKDLTHLDLDLTVIEQIFEDDVRGFIRELKGRDGFTEFETFPALVQIGILDLAYNMGVRHFYDEFKKFRAALKIRNWVKVADESRRSETDDKGNFLKSVQNRNNIVQGWFLLAINEEPFFVNPGCPPKSLNMMPS